VDRAPSPQPQAPKGIVRRVVDRLTKPAHELEFDELQGTGARLGATPIDRLVARQSATVVGEVRSVSLRPQAQVAALVVEIFDGTRPLNLVWLGRRAIAGIEPGVLLQVHGRVSYRRGVATIFNPVYEIVPIRG
jgi:RecG-like helicase